MDQHVRQSPQEVPGDNPTPLFDDKQVQQLFSLLVRSDRNQANDFATLIQYVDSMERQISHMTTELTQVRGQLAAMRQSPAHKALSAAAAKIESNIRAARETLSAIRTQIVEGAARAVESVKKSGLACLSRIASFIPIKEGLQDLRTRLEQSIDSVKELIGRVEAAGKELRSAGQSLKNAGRLVLGKEMKETGGNGGFASSLHSLKNTMEEMEKTAGNAVERLETLEQSAGQKPSVRQSLDALKNSPNPVKVTPRRKTEHVL